MTSENDQDFRARREKDARLAANTAVNEKARDAHLAMAERYAGGSHDPSLAMTGLRSTPSRKRQPWHADDIETLLTMLAQGARIPEISRRLGRTQEGVTKKAYLLDRLPVA